MEDDIVKNIVAILLINSEMGMTDNDILSEYEVLVGEKLTFPIFNYANLKDFLSRHSHKVEIYRSKFGNRYKAVEYDEAYLRNNYQRHDELASAFKRMEVCCGSKPQSNYTVPYDIRVNLLDIIEKYPNGVDLEDFLLEFCDLCGYELIPQNFSFTTHQNMFSQLSDIFSLRPTDKSIILYPTSQVLKPGIGSKPRLSCVDKMSMTKQKLLELLRAHQMCLKLGELQKEYFCYFGNYLNVEELGFGSVLDFIFHCQDIVDIDDRMNSREEILIKLKAV